MQKILRVYDYNDRVKEIELPDKRISAVCVCILSGDETGEVLFSDGSSLHFDSSDCRSQSFYYGSYTVRGPALEKWLSFTKADCSGMAYARQDAVEQWEEEETNNAP